MDFKVLLKALAGILVSALIVGLIIQLCRLMPHYSLLIGLLSYIIMVFIAYWEARKFKKTDGEQGIIVYTNYYDVFKCLSIFLVSVVVYYLGQQFGQSQSALIFCGIYATGMIIYVAYNTAKLNRFSMLPVIILVKLSISLIWVYALYEMLNPSGRTRADRRSSRANAVIALMLITPIITTLVLGQEGQELVQSRLAGRRFGGARELRNML